MMTKKSEMAEWILDFFRRARVDAGQSIMMRNVQDKLYELNPKERDLFVSVANELIENGYFSYEGGTPQSLRLTEKGRDYIYDDEAELDCCYDRRKVTKKDYMEVIEVARMILSLSLNERGGLKEAEDAYERLYDAILAIDDSELLNALTQYGRMLDEIAERRKLLAAQDALKDKKAAAMKHIYVNT